MPTNRETAAFEAGIKLGAIYHQFVGSPVSVDTAESLETAMRESISLQPHVRFVSVEIDRDMLRENFFGYGELAGKMIRALVEIDYEGAKVKAKLEYDQKLDYPLMSLLD
ncbi:MAG TPA: dihydroneopterin aldolase family protein [Methanothrix sp.]|nr:dihydroneopterin aldolase family protein [Methanothrix sp.]HPJ84418.1 dihydroneopterin aldolase family protein [Methanothrix sp.]HPR66897.1 dihydroneopterin aldolase family protein [Methanothrix sp.]